MDMAADKSRIFLLSLLINANGLARLRLFSAKLRIFLLTDHRSRLLRGLAVVFHRATASNYGRGKDFTKVIL